MEFLVIIIILLLCAVLDKLNNLEKLVKKSHEI
jgi:hypothetical protein